MWILLALVAIAAAHPHGKRGPPPCGLPSYVDDLPADAQEKVKAIWKDYKDGDKCYEEQGLTREILDTLPREKKFEIFKSGFMPFLKKASADIQKQFKELMKDKSIPWDQKPEKMKELAEKTLSGDLLKEFNEFYEKRQQERLEFKEKVAKLSSEAKEAYEKIEKLMEEKRKIFDSVSESARDELFDLFHSRWGHHFGGHRGHHH